MTLLELKDKVDRLLETQSPHTETTIAELIVRETGQGVGSWRYIDTISTERGLVNVGRQIEEMQRRITSTR